MENVVSRWRRDRVLRSKFGMTFDHLSQPIISLFVSFSFKLHLSTYTIMSPLSVQTGLSKCVALGQGCHGPSQEEWAIKQRVLNQPLLTPISGQQDEAPVAPGFVVFLLYTPLSLLHTLLLSPFIVTLLLMASPLWQCRSIALSLLPACLCFASSSLLHNVSHHPCYIPRMLTHQKKKLKKNLCINIECINFTNLTAL